MKKDKYTYYFFIYVLFGVLVGRILFPIAFSISIDTLFDVALVIIIFASTLGWLTGIIAINSRCNFRGVFRKVVIYGLRIGNVSLILLALILMPPTFLGSLKANYGLGGGLFITIIMMLIILGPLFYVGVTLISLLKHNNSLHTDPGREQPHR